MVWMRGNLNNAASSKLSRFLKNQDKLFSRAHAVVWKSKASAALLKAVRMRSVKVRGKDICESRYRQESEYFSTMVVKDNHHNRHDRLAQCGQCIQVVQQG